MKLTAVQQRGRNWITTYDLFSHTTPVQGSSFPKSVDQSIPGSATDPWFLVGMITTSQPPPHKNQPSHLMNPEWTLPTLVQCVFILQPWLSLHIKEISHDTPSGNQPWQWRFPAKKMISHCQDDYQRFNRHEQPSSAAPVRMISSHHIQLVFLKLLDNLTTAIASIVGYHHDIHMKYHE